MTRTDARYDRKLIDMMVADGFAKAYPLRDGTVNYVAKVDGRTFAIRASQIFDVAPEDMPVILVDGEVFDDNAAEAALADAEAGPFQQYKALAREAGVSVGEYTDGEYGLDRDGIVRSAEELANLAADEEADRKDLATRNAVYERAVAPAGTQFDRMNALVARFS